MIELKFGLFWSGSKLSYLRYLTFLSLRKAHPNAVIELYTPERSNTDVSWGIEKQDFQTYDGPCYLDKVIDLNVKIIRSDLFPTYAPNFQSDFFRWWWLYNNGGFYLDTDQIIIKSFEGLPLDSELIYSMYRAHTCGVYAPVGVIGAEKKSPVVKYIMDKMTDHYDPSVYNSIGPFMFRDEMTNKMEDWKDRRLFNAPPSYFYPVPESYMVQKLYEGETHIVSEAFALHWFGGHPRSQEFNNKYSEEMAETSNDTISSLKRMLL